ncbi:retrotransposon protein, putative, ty1-copia subclass [Tanacetum coccineum]
MFVIEQPLPAAPAADSEAQVLSQWNAVYDAYNEVACLILGSMTPELHRQFENSSPYDMIKELKAMFEKQAGVERFDLIQTFHACKQEEGKPVAAYVIQMKGYVDQLERLGYMLPQDLIVGLILNGLTKDFARFVRNYNMHNMGKTIGELHAMLIEYEKGLPKKAETPQVMMIKGGKIQKAKKKLLKAKAREVGHWKWNCPVYLAELLKKKKQVSSAISLGKMTRKSFPHRPKRVTDLLGIIHTDVCGPLRHVSLATSLHSRMIIVVMLTPPYISQHNGLSKRRNRTLLDMVRSMMNLTTLPLSFWDYALESAIRILNMVPTKKVDKTPYELWYGKVPNLSYLKVWGCEALVKQDTPEKL